jgi:hypothetical protein
MTVEERSSKSRDVAASELPTPPMYLVIACKPDLPPLRYELEMPDAFHKARQLRRWGWAVYVLQELGPNMARGTT